MTIRLLFIALLVTILGAAPPEDTRSLSERLLEPTPPVQAPSPGPHLARTPSRAAQRHCQAISGHPNQDQSGTRITSASTSKSGTTAWVDVRVVQGVSGRSVSMIDSEDDPPNYRHEYTAMAVVKTGALIILCGIAALAIMGVICM